FGSPSIVLLPGSANFNCSTVGGSSSCTCSAGTTFGSGIRTWSTRGGGGSTGGGGGGSSSFTGGGSCRTTSVSIICCVCSSAPRSTPIHLAIAGAIKRSTNTMEAENNPIFVAFGESLLRSYAPYALFRPSKTTSSQSFLNISNFEPNIAVVLCGLT